MIQINKANSILDNLLRQQYIDGEDPHYVYRYLGFSSTLPSVDTTMTPEGQPSATYGQIINFTEPDESTGYKRLLMSPDNLSSLNEAKDAQIKNTDYNLSFPIPDKGQEYGKAVAIGFFESDSAKYPYFSAELKEEVTLGPKSTLVIYKDDFTVKLTAEKATETSTG